MQPLLWIQLLMASLYDSIECRLNPKKNIFTHLETSCTATVFCPPHKCVRVHVMPRRHRSSDKPWHTCTSKFTLRLQTEEHIIQEVILTQASAYTEGPVPQMQTGGSSWYLPLHLKALLHLILDYIVSLVLSLCSPPTLICIEAESFACSVELLCRAYQKPCKGLC